MGLRRSEWLALLRDVVPVVVVAYVVFVLIRAHLCERYTVPSPSMEPTLHGDRDDGDVVLVDKTAWWRWRAAHPEPFDLVVVRNRLQPGSDHIVKRFIAAGPGYVALREGDVFFGEDPARLERVVKHPSEFRDLRVTAFAVEPGEAERIPLDYLHRDDAAWSVRDGSIRLHCAPADQQQAALTAAARAARAESEDANSRWLPNHLAPANEIDTSFLDSRGRRLAALRDLPVDVGLELELELPEACEGLQLVVEEFGVYYSFRCDADGSGVMQRMGVAIGESFRGPALRRSESVRVAFGYLDGHAFLEIDEQLVAWRPVELIPPVPIQLPRTRPPRFRNLVHVGAIGPAGASVTVRRLRVFHDVFYAPESGERFRLESGHVFLLGDHTYNSTDSRSRPDDPFRSDDLIGRPVAILAPRDRMAWLPR